MLPLECIVRGYITGSAWKEYTEHQTMHGHELPAGLLESSQLPEPVFTPSSKATEGHDVNISYEQAADLVGNEVAELAREICLAAYSHGAAIARDRGIIIADTKFELGIIDGEIAICDEILTPDSSRFWPADAWKPGSAPPSFDKQPVRGLGGVDGMGQGVHTPCGSRVRHRRDEGAVRTGLRADIWSFLRVVVGRRVRGLMNFLCSR